MSEIQRSIVLPSFQWVWKIAETCVSGSSTLIVRSLQVACIRNQCRSAVWRNCSVISWKVCCCTCWLKCKWEVKTPEVVHLLFVSPGNTLPRLDLGMLQGSFISKALRGGWCNVCGSVLKHHCYDGEKDKLSFDFAPLCAGCSEDPRWMCGVGSKLLLGCKGDLCCLFSSVKEADLGRRNKCSETLQNCAECLS